MQSRANNHVTAGRKKNEKENRKAPGPVPDPRERVCYLPQTHNALQWKLRDSDPFLR